ncbi:hypothetical protein AAGS39_32560 [Flavobacterium sp. CGRL2]
MNINGIDKKQNQTIDSIPYAKKHSNLKSLYNEIELVSKELTKQGYTDSKKLETYKINDSTFTSTIDLKNKIKEVHIYIGINSFFSESKKNSKRQHVYPLFRTRKFFKSRNLKQ